jgi:hypothetical protein
MVSKSKKIQALLDDVEAVVKVHFDHVPNMHVDPMASIVRGFLEPEYLCVEMNEFCSDQLPDNFQVVDLLIGATDCKHRVDDVSLMVAEYENEDNKFSKVYQRKHDLDVVPDVVVEITHHPYEEDKMEAEMCGEPEPSPHFSSHLFSEVVPVEGIMLDTIGYADDKYYIDKCAFETYCADQDVAEWDSNGLLRGWAQLFPNDGTVKWMAQGWKP